LGFGENIDDFDKYLKIYTFNDTSLHNFSIEKIKKIDFSRDYFSNFSVDDNDDEIIS
jgi:hypothetical protein